MMKEWLVGLGVDDSVTWDGIDDVGRLERPRMDKVWSILIEHAKKELILEQRITEPVDLEEPKRMSWR